LLLGLWKKDHRHLGSVPACPAHCLAAPAAAVAAGQPFDQLLLLLPGQLHPASLQAIVKGQLHAVLLLLKSLLVLLERLQQLLLLLAAWLLQQCVLEFPVLCWN
jgi:hypothetical protein